MPMPANPSAVPPSRREVEELIAYMHVKLAQSMVSADNDNYAALTLTIKETQLLLAALSAAGAPAAVPDPEQ
jgi:hypothetical protein